MNRVLMFMLTLCTLLVLGCDTQSPAAPEANAALVLPQGAVQAWVEIDGVETLAWVIQDKNAPRGMYRILYICNGPDIGPLLPGQCRANDPTSCSSEPLPGDYEPWTAPTIRTAADADGIVVR